MQQTPVPGTHKKEVIKHACTTENLPNWLAMPRNRLSSEILIGALISHTAPVSSGSAEIACFSTVWPRNLSWNWLNKHFSELRVTPALFIHSKTAFNLESWTFWSAPWTRTSSSGQTTPSKPSRTLLICFWKCSGALQIPNGSLLKQNLPNGVRKVVKRQDSSSTRICQNPKLASNLLNTSAQAGWPWISSTLGRKWISRSTFELSLCRST